MAQNQPSVLQLCQKTEDIDAIGGSMDQNNAPAGDVVGQDKVPFEVATTEESPGGYPDLIPDHFIKYLCFAYTFQRKPLRECFGCKMSATACCIENSTVCCKPVDYPGAYFICWSGAYEVVTPKTCKLYEQCFCWECFCAFPSVKDGYRNTPIAISTVQDEFIPKSMGESTICCGLCFFIQSCYCDFPSCLGVYEKGVLLCLESELIMCKPMCYNSSPMNPDTICVCIKGHTSVVLPDTCLKLIGQVLFVDHRCAIPCDKEVPCIVTPLPFCTCTCCIKDQYNMYCFQSISQYLNNYATNPVKVAAHENTHHGSAEVVLRSVEIEPEAHETYASIR